MQYLEKHKHLEPNMSIALQPLASKLIETVKEHMNMTGGLMGSIDKSMNSSQGFLDGLSGVNIKQFSDDYGSEISVP